MYDKILSQDTFPCACGKTHKRTTERIIIENGAIRFFPELVKEIMPYGEVGLVFFQDVKKYADIIKSDLEGAGYKIATFQFAKNTQSSIDSVAEIENASDEIRVFIGVGTGSVSDIIKAGTVDKEIEYLHFLTAPSTESIFYNIAEVSDEDDYKLIATKVPKFVVADLMVLKECPKNLVAAGYGVLYSAYLSLFDNTYSKRIGQFEYCDEIALNIKKTLDNFFTQNNSPLGKDFVGLLTNTLFKVGLLIQASGNPNVLLGTNYNFAYLLRSENCHELLVGENLFISSFITSTYYYLLLTSTSLDLLLPPDKITTIRHLANCAGLNVAGSIEKLDSECTVNYEKVSHIATEYKEDMLNELNDLLAVSRTAVKNFRRIYDDAGYFLKDYCTFEELMRTMSMSALFYKKYSYLNYAKDSGYLERYVSGGHKVV